MKLQWKVPPMLYAICMRRGGVNQSYFLLGWGGGGGGGGGGGNPGELGGGRGAM